MPRAGSSIDLMDSKLSHGYSALRSTSAARGAILSSQNWRMTARNSRCSSESVMGCTPSVSRTEVLQQQPVEVAGRLLGDPVADAVQHLEAVGPAHVVAAGVGTLRCDGDVAVAPHEHGRRNDRPEVGDEA